MSGGVESVRVVSTQFDIQGLAITLKTAFDSEPV